MVKWRQQNAMPSLKKYNREWNELAALDALWAILSNPQYKHGRWNLKEFFATGETDIAQLMQTAETLAHPQQRENALDFGCGVGRLTRAMARHFSVCHGVDISERMIAKAVELNRDEPRCRFLLNVSDRLPMFADNQFDLVYAYLVLQHLSSRALIVAYIAEFVRVLRPGGLLAFQLPSYIPPRHRPRLRSKLYTVLRKFGVRSDFLFTRMNLYPGRLHFIPEPDVLEQLTKLGARVLHVRADTPLEALVQSKTYFATK